MKSRNQASQPTHRMAAPCRTPLAEKPRVSAIALILGLGCTATAYGADGLFDLGLLNGGTESVANGISADGSIVIGTARNGAAGNALRAIRWAADGSTQSLGTLGGTWSEAKAISADGSTIVGIAAISSGPGHAFRWTAAGGMQSLNTLGGTWSEAKAVSGNGDTVVGIAADSSGADRAFRWTTTNGIQNLGTLNNGTTSRAFGVSTDGRAVTGSATDGANGNAWRAFLWTEGGSMQSLGTLNGGGTSFANGISADGSTVVGEGDDGANSNAWRAFRWTAADGMQSLGTLNGGNNASAWTVSANGSTVVGGAADGAAGNADRAFRWTAATGMQSIEEWLASHGVAVSPTLHTKYANAISADGSVVAGQLENDHAFIARIAPTGSGLITLADLRQSLAETAAAGDTMLRFADLLLNGAHGRPLSRRVAAGRNIFWTAGDWGTDDHGDHSGHLGLAEVGVGRNFGPFQVNVSAGRTWAYQNLSLDGSARVDGAYLLAEALIPVIDNLWATLGAYGHRGDAEIERAYLNAGLRDESRGTPDVDTWGLRARLDWVGAFRAAGTAFSPYVDLTYSKASLDAYTEKSGGFPAHFDDRSEYATELRLGLNADKPLADGINFFATLEAAHRFEDEGAGTSGRVIGLFAFDLNGRNNQRDWLRAGVGIEGEVAKGIASVSVNATTQGETPSAWLAASWRMAF